MSSVYVVTSGLRSDAPSVHSIHATVEGADEAAREARSYFSRLRGFNIEPNDWVEEDQTAGKMWIARGGMATVETAEWEVRP